MNFEAYDLGLLSTKYVLYFKQVNPHGLPDIENYSTAYDQAILSCVAYKNDLIKSICS